MSIAAASAAQPVVPVVDVAYGIARMPGDGWELSVEGRPIARVRQCVTGWSVLGIFDRKARESFSTLEGAVKAATYRY